MRLSKKTLGLIVGLLFGLSANAHSAVLEWSLETIAPTPSTASVSETVGGVTFTITRPGASFSIDDLSSYPIPSTWGNRTLGPFNNVNGFGFVGNFSRTVSNVSIEFGDFLPSDFDALTIEGYSGSDGTGTLLGSVTSTLCCGTGTGFEYSSLLLAISGINSIRFIGGSAEFPHSLYYDNFRAEVDMNEIPEPATLGLLGLGMIGLGAVSRRRSVAREHA